MQTTTTEPTAANRVENGGAYRAREEIESYCAYLKALHRDPKTVAVYAFGVRRFLDFLEKRGVRDLRSVKRADVLAYQIGLTASTLAPQTTHSRLRAVRRLFEYLDDLGRILVNPAVDLPMPKLGSRLPRVVLTKAEMRRLLDAPDTSLSIGIRDKAILELFYSTGLRVAELCGLTIHDVDLLNGYVRVNCGKGCKDRVVPIGHKARAYVNEYLRHVRGLFTRNIRDERALFVGARHAGSLTTTRVEQIVRHYAKAAGIEKRVTPHVFRHTCATHLLQGGADISQVQRLLGHVMISTTQVYTRVALPEVKATHRKTHPRERDEP